MLGMNRAAFPETLQCVNQAGNHCPNMTVLERQHASLKWQQQQESCPDSFGPGLNPGEAFCLTSQGLMVANMVANKTNNNNNPVKLDLGTYDGWPNFGGFRRDMGLMEVNYGIIPKMSEALPPVAMSTQVVMAEEKVKSGQEGDESLGKRKFDKLSIIKTEDDNGRKKMKGFTEGAESKLTDQSNNHCKSNNNKENAKNSEVQKLDYIHVRARRGQATDSHSLAERVRREKISERMKFLQDLVPGCNKITGKAGMLDEIINYVQSLQRQVEFLSMKLAVVNPSLDIDIDSLFAKEITPACAPNFPSIEMPLPSDLQTQGFFHLNPTNQLVSHAGVASGVNPNPGIWRTISAPLPATEKFLEASSFAQIQAQSATWDDISLQNLYNIEFQLEGRTMPFPSHQYTGSLEAGNMNIEM